MAKKTKKPAAPKVSPTSEDSIMTQLLQAVVALDQRVAAIESHIRKGATNVMGLTSDVTLLKEAVYTLQGFRQVVEETCLKRPTETPASAGSPASCGAVGCGDTH